MISAEEHEAAKAQAAELLRRAGVLVTSDEERDMDTADFGLGRLRVEGAQIVSWFDTPRVSARVIALFPGQTEPEHWHTSTSEHAGKEETLRVVFGQLLLYVTGEGQVRHGAVPEGKQEYYTARQEHVMFPGDQFTVPPGTKHWFQAGDEGAVVLTLSTRATDDQDLFSDPNVVRLTCVGSRPGSA